MGWPRHRVDPQTQLRVLFFETKLTFALGRVRLLLLRDRLIHLLLGKHHKLLGKAGKGGKLLGRQQVLGGFRKRRESLFHRCSLLGCLMHALPLGRPKGLELLTPIGIDFSKLFGKLLPGLIVLLLGLPCSELRFVRLAFLGLSPRRVLGLIACLEFRFDLGQSRSKRGGVLGGLRLVRLRSRLDRHWSVGCLFGFGCDGTRRR